MWNKLTLYLWSLSFLIWIYLKGRPLTRAKPETSGHFFLFQMALQEHKQESVLKGPILLTLSSLFS